MQLQSWLHPWMWLSSNRHALVPHLQPVWDSYTTIHWHWLTFWRTDVKTGGLLTIRSCNCKAGSNSGFGCPRRGMSCSLICSCMGLKCHFEVAVADFLKDWWDFVHFWFPAFLHETYFFNQKTIKIWRHAWFCCCCLLKKDMILKTYLFPFICTCFMHEY